MWVGDCQAVLLLPQSVYSLPSGRHSWGLKVTAGMADCFSQTLALNILKLTISTDLNTRNNSWSWWVGMRTLEMFLWQRRKIVHYMCISCNRGRDDTGVLTFGFMCSLPLYPTWPRCFHHPSLSSSIKTLWIFFTFTVAHFSTKHTTMRDRNPTPTHWVCPTGLTPYMYSTSVQVTSTAIRHLSDGS